MPTASWRSPGASSPTAVITPDSWRHRTATVPERAQLKGWVAEDAGRHRRLRPRVPELLHGGLDDRLRLARRPRPRIDAAVSDRSSTSSPSRMRVSTAPRRCSPRSTRTSPASLSPAAAGSERCVPRRIRASTRAPSASVPRLRSTCARLRMSIRVLVYTVDMEATRDIPATEPMNVMPYEDWRQHVLEHPLFAPEGSFVAMVDGVAAAVSLITGRRQRACDQHVHRNPA